MQYRNEAPPSPAERGSAMADAVSAIGAPIEASSPVKTHGVPERIITMSEVTTPATTILPTTTDDGAPVEVKLTVPEAIAAIVADEKTGVILDADVLAKTADDLYTATGDILAVMDELDAKYDVLAPLTMATRVAVEWKGQPDFSGKSTTYREYLRIAVYGRYPNLSDSRKGRVQAGVRQNILANGLAETAIVEYVTATVNNAATDEAVRNAAIVEVANKAGLDKVSEKYAPKVNTAATANRTAAEVKADKLSRGLTSAVEAVAAVTADGSPVSLIMPYRAAHRIVSDVTRDTVRRFTTVDASETIRFASADDRQEAIDRIQKMTLLLQIASGAIEGSASTADLADLASLYWSADQ